MTEIKLVEEKEGKIYVNAKAAICSNCDKQMGGFFFKFYKQPGFSELESMSSIIFYDIWFQCGFCTPVQTLHLPKEQVDKINQYPLGDIEFPEGGNKQIKRLGIK